MYFSSWRRHFHREVLLGAIACTFCWSQFFFIADQASSQEAGLGGASTAVSDETLPEVPETIVPGRTGTFPLKPLAEDVVVTATNTATPLRDVGSSITVITGEQLAARQQATVGEALRGSVGLDVVRQGGIGGATSVFLRGGNSAHTKVLLDGIPVNDPSNASRLFDFSNLSIDNIERIEILRGPQSVLYGSDAVTGVVNIITKRGQGPLTLKASAMGGSFGTSQESVHASGGNEQIYYSFSGSYLNTNGISSANSRRGNPEHDGYRNGTISGRVGWNPDENWNIDYVFRWSDARTEIDDFSFFTGLPVDNLIRANLTRQFYNRVQLQNVMLDGQIQQRVSFSLTDYDRNDTDPGLFSPGRFLGQTRLVNYQADLQLLENNTFTAGASYQQEDASSSFDPQAVLNDKAAYIQDKITLFDRWTTTVGFRWDDYNQAGPAQTYRIASIYQLEETATSFHASLGTGFRAPALAESLFAFGNPNLRPERSKGWDAGVSQQFLDDIIVLDATYFRNDLTDLIIFDFNTFALENVGRARTSGVEFSGKLRLTSRTDVNGSYTFTDTLNYDTNLPLLRRPRDKATIGIDHYFPNDRTTLGVYALLVGQRLDTNNSTLGNYSVINLVGRHQYGPRTEFFARIDNVFNARYEEVRGFGVPGVSGFAGANFTW